MATYADNVRKHLQLLQDDKAVPSNNLSDPLKCPLFLLQLYSHRNFIYRYLLC